MLCFKFWRVPGKGFLKPLIPGWSEGLAGCWSWNLAHCIYSLCLFQKCWLWPRGSRENGGLNLESVLQILVINEISRKNWFDFLVLEWTGHHCGLCIWARTRWLWLLLFQLLSTAICWVTSALTYSWHLAPEVHLSLPIISIIILFAIFKKLLFMEEKSEISIKQN